MIHTDYGSVFLILTAALLLRRALRRQGQGGDGRGRGKMTDSTEALKNYLLRGLGKKEKNG